MKNNLAAITVSSLTWCG